MVSKVSEVFVIKFELLPVSILIFTGIDKLVHHASGQGVLSI